MDFPRQKRNYVKRKRSLNECSKTILQTLQAINQRQNMTTNSNAVNTNGTEQKMSSLKKIAMNHAEAIEAACWSRRAKFSNSVFTQIVRAKTLELCSQLLAGSKVVSNNGNNISNISKPVNNIPKMNENQNQVVGSMSGSSSNEESASSNSALSISSSSLDSSPTTYEKQPFSALGANNGNALYAINVNNSTSNLSDNSTSPQTVNNSLLISIPSYSMQPPAVQTIQNMSANSITNIYSYNNPNIVANIQYIQNIRGPSPQDGHESTQRLSLISMQNEPHLQQQQQQPSSLQIQNSQSIKQKEKGKCVLPPIRSLLAL